MPIIYRGCHSKEEFLRILLYQTAGGWDERFAHRQAPSELEALGVGIGGQECSALTGNGERQRNWTKDSIVEYATAYHIAKQFTRWGLVEVTVPSTNIATTSERNERQFSKGAEGIVTYVSEPVLRVVGWSGPKHELDIICNPKDGKMPYSYVRKLIISEKLNYLLPVLERAKMMRRA